LTINISNFNNTQAKYHDTFHARGKIIYNSNDKNHKSIAIGIVHVTAIFAKGDIIDTCQKLKIIIGKVNTSAANVKTSASLIANI
jgi:hypothetical protein